ncbi:MAG: hypothetical protein Q4E07_02280, partial [Eubacteriales bacterium]|nr:hypothetical protein [Eubacteriales bacterium]
MLYRKVLTGLLCLLILISPAGYSEELSLAWREAVKYVPASAMPTDMNENNGTKEFIFDDLNKHESYTVILGLDLKPIKIKMQKNGELENGDNIGLESALELFLSKFPDAEESFLLPYADGYIASAQNVDKQCLYSANIKSAGGVIASFEISYAYGANIETLVASVFSTGAVPLSLETENESISVTSFYAGNITNIILSANGEKILQPPALEITEDSKQTRQNATNKESKAATGENSISYNKENATVVPDNQVSTPLATTTVKPVPTPSPTIIVDDDEADDYDEPDDEIIHDEPDDEPDGNEPDDETIHDEPNNETDDTEIDDETGNNEPDDETIYDDPQDDLDDDDESDNDDDDDDEEYDDD